MKRDGLKRKRTKTWTFKRCFLLLLPCILILTACGGTGKGSEAPSGAVGPEEGQVHYQISETAVPDPDEALAALEKGEGETLDPREMDYRFGGERLYRLVRLYVREEGTDGTGEDVDSIREVRYYLQVLDPPYGEWKVYRLTASCWDAEAEHEVYSPCQIIAAGEDKVYLEVSYSGNDAHYIGTWREDGSGELLGVLPEELQDMVLIMGDRRVEGAYKTYQDSLLLLGGEPEGVQIRSRVAASGNVWGVLWDPKGERLLWYGLDEERKTGVWQAADNAEVARLPEGKGNVSLAACSEEGILYLANGQELWCYSEKGELESLCRFSDLDYYLEDLHGMSVREESVLLLAWYEGKDHVLRVEKGEGTVREKQKILLAADQGISQSHLRQAIAQFNRQNREYRVEVIEPEEGENVFDFLDRLQREILAGGVGPDLFFGLGMRERAEDFIRNGYLQEVSDFLPEEGVLWQAAVESGAVNGRQYGIPYECRLRFATYHQELTEGRDAWTLDEMMAAVRASGAEALQAGASGFDIVMDYGLYDNDNRKFIDWEKGESHLDEAPFLAFLAFAKEYADESGRTGREDPRKDPDTRLLDGRVVAKHDVIDVQELSHLNGLYASFQGTPACIGYPREEGNGIYVMSTCFYVSSLTKQKEGCKAFLDFLLSEEVQDDYVEFGSGRHGAMATSRPSMLAVRLSALERNVQLMRRESGLDGFQSITEEGIVYSTKGFSEEQEATFWFLLERARPAIWYAQEIQGMAREELAPYFAGQRTAEEAARLLDNRVQLYLDERK